MKYLLWKLLGRRFWIKLNSHYYKHGSGSCYSEWQQKRNTIKKHYIYEFSKAFLEVR